jgi:rubrerythrin
VASGAKSLFARRMFEELAREEDVHGRRVLEIFETLKKDDAFKQWNGSIAVVTTPVMPV